MDGRRPSGTNFFTLVKKAQSFKNYREVMSFGGQVWRLSLSLRTMRTVFQSSLYDPVLSLSLCTVPQGASYHRG